MDNREKIILHACELFRSRGIRSVTMDSLATDLSISKRTIYELFTDKDSLVMECVKRILLRDNEVLMGILKESENVIEAILKFLRHQKTLRETYTPAFVEDFKRYLPAVHATFYSCKEDLKKFSASYTLLEKGRREGVFRPGMDIEMVDHFIHEMMSVIHTSPRLLALGASD
ncbi:MAG TPA: TetR/AcrR family transcriptional regulator, partial [Bacteroidales bacterium]|nr:TetR/AcrR family transcriptional regulator [Bacteroidales bacterium]